VSSSIIVILVYCLIYNGVYTLSALKGAGKMKIKSVLMKIKNNGFAAILLLTASMGIANAALILDVDDRGQLIGAQDVMVTIGGEDMLYDVRFVEDSYENIFDDIAVAANGLDEANAFSSALMNLVFLDSSAGNFDSEARFTLGCFRSDTCNILTPYGILFNQFESRVFQNTDNNATDAIFNSPLNLFSYSTRAEDEFVFAVWTQSDIASAIVSEPATIGLLFLGLAGMVLRRRGAAA
jgi:hypothetical protein